MAAATGGMEKVVKNSVEDSENEDALVSHPLSEFVEPLCGRALAPFGVSLGGPGHLYEKPHVPIHGRNVAVLKKRKSRSGPKKG